MPVYLKGGLKDVLLYRATMTLTVLGMSAFAYDLMSQTLLLLLKLIFFFKFL